LPVPYQRQHRFMRTGLFAIALGIASVAFFQAAHAQSGLGGVSPVNGPVTSGFGWRADPYTGQSRFHAGVDIAADTGTPIRVPLAGQVVFAGEYGGYGLVVVVQHSPQLATLYGHASAIYVPVGQWVNPGDVLAAVGSTGRSTGPHVHFEVRQQTPESSGFVDPLEFLTWLEQSPSERLASRPAPPPVPTHAGRESAVGGPAESTPSESRRITLSPRRTGDIEVIQGSDRRWVSVSR